MVDAIPSRLSKKNNPLTIATVETDKVMERWYYQTPLNLLSQSQKKVIMARVLSQMVKITFETHVYEWNGEIYSQGEGCPTGLRPSGSISRIVMDHWVKRMKGIEEKPNTLATLNPVIFSIIKTTC